MNSRRVLAAAIVIFSSVLLAQTQTVPFNIFGHIQSFKLDTDCPTNLLCGATMKVNGITVMLPKNTIIWFPAAFLTPNDVFRWMGPDSAKPSGATDVNLPGFPLQPSSGLALEDPTPPIASFEAQITGNITTLSGGTAKMYIAGLVKISQQSLNATDGFILGIDQVKGELTVGPESAALSDPAAVKVRINDPEGRFGLKRPSYDWRFAVDDENATIHSATGYPMCIPRSPADVECPDGNRPTNAGARRKRFTMGMSMPCSV